MSQHWIDFVGLVEHTVSKNHRVKMYKRNGHIFSIEFINTENKGNLVVLRKNGALHFSSTFSHKILNPSTNAIMKFTADNVCTREEKWIDGYFEETLVENDMTDNILVDISGQDWYEKLSKSL